MICELLRLNPIYFDLDFMVGFLVVDFLLSLWFWRRYERMREEVSSLRAELEMHRHPSRNKR